MSIDPKIVTSLNVSRETLDQLSAYVALVEKWQPKINLIANSTLSDIWSRHILDSAQLIAHISPATKTILDIGSGGGFPGLVLAIMCDAHIHLVESDQRKSIFLRTVVRELGLTATIHNERIELLHNVGADVITARAVAPVAKLLDLLEKQFTSTNYCLFLKGARVDEELTVLESYSNISHRTYPSVTSSDGVVLALTIDN